MQRVSLEFYIDVHAHSTMLNGFMYGNVFEDEERVQRQAVFPRLLCQNAPDFSLVSLSARGTGTPAQAGGLGFAISAVPSARQARSSAGKALLTGCAAVVVVQPAAEGAVLLFRMDSRRGVDWLE